MLVKHLHGDRDETGVSDPCTVVTSSDLAELVGGDLVIDLVIGRLVVLDWDVGRHAAHGCDFAPEGSACA